MEVYNHQGANLPVDKEGIPSLHPDVLAVDTKRGWKIGNIAGTRDLGKSRIGEVHHKERTSPIGIKGIFLYEERCETNWTSKGEGMISVQPDRGCGVDQGIDTHLSRLITYDKELTCRDDRGDGPGPCDSFDTLQFGGIRRIQNGQGLPKTHIGILLMEGNRSTLPPHGTQ